MYHSQIHRLTPPFHRIPRDWRQSRSRLSRCSSCLQAGSTTYKPTSTIPLSDRLFHAQKGEDMIGPESVAVDSARDLIYAGTADGKIFRISPPPSRSLLSALESLPEDSSLWTKTAVAQLLGRPLGLQVDKHGSLFVCESTKGLLRLDTPFHKDLSEISMNIVSTVSTDQIPIRYSNVGTNTLLLSWLSASCLSDHQKKHQQRDCRIWISSKTKASSSFLIRLRFLLYW